MIDDGDGGLIGWRDAESVADQTRVRAPWLAQKLGLQTRGGMSHGITQIARRLDEDGKLEKK